MKKKNKISSGEALSAIKSGRERTNILRKGEQNSLAYLVRIIPAWISPDMLTAIGFIGNVMVGASLFLGTYFDRYYLLFGILGFAISWFGDSLDGRLAYFRKTPRKWYGMTLDISVDWLGIIFIGIGFITYLGDPWSILGYFFVVLYGWQMITVILKFKITDEYSIDAGLLGPTEVRIILSTALTLEVFFPGFILYFGILTNLILFILNLVDLKKLLVLADLKDKQEKKNLKND